MSNEHQNHSEVPLTGSEAIALKDFEDYIAAFNGQDLSRIAQSLAEDVAVLLEGKEVARGRNAILPSYEKDFRAGKSVTVIRGPSVVTVRTTARQRPDSGASETVSQAAAEQADTIEVHVSVSLRTVETATKERTDLDVVYVYDPDVSHQIRHEISNVCSSAS